MQGLTKRQREIVEFIEAFSREHRHSPSYREIQKYFGFSSLGSVYNHIQTLKKKGVVPLNTKQARSLTVQDTSGKQGENVDIPFIGKLREGMPIETFPQIWMIPLPPQMVPSGSECYLLQIEGEELSEERMQQGDLLLVHPRTHFDEGEMVIALVDDHTTFVKRAFSTPPYLRLESANPQVQPLILREDHTQIQGVVISLLRHYSV